MFGQAGTGTQQLSITIGTHSSDRPVMTGGEYQGHEFELIVDGFDANISALYSVVLTSTGKVLIPAQANASTWDDGGQLRRGLSPLLVSVFPGEPYYCRIRDQAGSGAWDSHGGQMSQQASDLPRFVQILGRYRALIGVMAALGLLAGAVFAALNPPVFTSQALVVLPAPCPAGAICGGPVFAPDYLGTRLLRSLPAGVQIEHLAGNVLSVSATAGTAAQAEATADAAARSYLAYEDSLSYSSGQASTPILEPATRATGTAPLIRLRDDMLLGAVFGALLGVIAALAGSAATIDTLAAPVGYDVGEEKNRAGQETRYGSTGALLQQLALEYVNGRAVRDSTPGRSEAEPFWSASPF
jgi:hypothetical protein